jgi:hypothetical protein
MQDAQAAYECNQHGYNGYGSELGMQIEVPSWWDEDFFILYEQGDLAPTPE